MSGRGLFSRWCFVVALVFAGAATAGAQNQDKIDPARIRFITPTASFSSCVGTPTTPMCGIETLIGCSHYIWNEGCESINKRVYPRAREAIRIEYVIMKAGFVNRDRVRAVHAKDEADGLDLGHFPWLSEDAFQAKVLVRECSAASTNCRDVPWATDLYVVNPYDANSRIWIFAIYGTFSDENWFAD